MDRLSGLLAYLHTNLTAVQVHHPDGHPGNRVGWLSADTPTAGIVGILTDTVRYGDLHTRHELDGMVVVPIAEPANLVGYLVDERPHAEQDEAVRVYSWAGGRLSCFATLTHQEFWERCRSWVNRLQLTKSSRLVNLPAFAAPRPAWPQS